MSKSFQFKKFTVHQDKTAMKVGTDGVLLGAWTELDNPYSVLDIGAGTGLISLIVAQRSNAEVIDAVELEDNAYEQTVENFENSEWSDRLFCYHASFQELVNEMDDEEYDFIISNPPFYNSTYKKLGKERALARHSESLSSHELLFGVSKLLAKEGSFSVIIPFNEENNFIKIAGENDLFANKITRVKGTSKSKTKRSLIQFSFRKKPLVEDELVIEIERHNYTKDYKKIVKDFYLKM